MTVEDVENLLKAQLKSVKVEEETSDVATEKETFNIGKERRNRVHLEKIERPSQAERRKNKNVDSEFFRQDFKDSREEKKQVKVFIMKWEKELIAKIQISQLVSDNPMRDDFYCQIYTQNSAARKESALSKKERGKKKSGVYKIQQQMTRLIEKRKSKGVKEPSNLNKLKNRSVGRCVRENFGHVFEESETNLVCGFNDTKREIQSRVYTVTEKCVEFY